MSNRIVPALQLTGATASANGDDMDNWGCGYAHIVINITTITGTTPTATFTVEGKDTLSGQYYTLIASTALNATGVTVLKIGAGLTAAANLVVNDCVPKIWRVRVTTGGTVTNLTCTVCANLID